MDAESLGTWGAQVKDLEADAQVGRGTVGGSGWGGEISHRCLLDLVQEVPTGTKG